MTIKVIRSVKKDLLFEDADKDIFTDESFLNDLKIIAESRHLGIEDAKLLSKKYLKEIAAQCSKNGLFWNIAEFIVRKKIIGSFETIYYEKEKFRNIQNLAKENIITIVPNHRSVFDFIALSYLLVKETSYMPIILAADVFNKFPMGYFFRKTGAYYVRRNETDEIYHLVFKHYVMLILKYELVHLFFIEGGRNKIGGYSEPKTGMLKYLIEGKMKYNIQKEVLFFPINISYDCVAESNVVIQESISGKKQSIYSSVSKYVTKGDLGNCYITIGNPLKLSDFLRKSSAGIEPIHALGNTIIKNIKEIVAVSPIALACFSLLNKSSISLPEFEKIFLSNYEKLKASAKNINHIDTSKIRNYLRFANNKGIIDFNEQAGLIFIDNRKKLIVEYYSNNIKHLF